VTRSLSVAVFVGTDHHPFDRLVSTVDNWLGATSTNVHVVIQHGSSARPALAEGMPIVGHDEVARIMHEADVVVCHGGPATIADARAAGHQPLVMARDPRRGEHVDNHQMLFAARLAKSGLVTLVNDESELVVALEAAAVEPRSHAAEFARHSRALVGGDDTSAAVEKIGEVVNALIGGAPQRRRSRPATKMARVRSRSVA
jgi:UDP-N-acetylglucosamine transferase subunit ALG13